MIGAALLALGAAAFAREFTWWLVRRSERWGATIGSSGWRFAHVPVGGMVVGALALLVGSTLLGVVAIALAWGAIEMRWLDAPYGVVERGGRGAVGSETRMDVLVDGEPLTYERMIELRLRLAPEIAQFDVAKGLPADWAERIAEALRAQDIEHEVRVSS